MLATYVLHNGTRVPAGHGHAPDVTDPRTAARADVYGDLSATASGMVVGNGSSDRDLDRDGQYLPDVTDAGDYVKDDGTVTYVERNGSARTARLYLTSRTDAFGNSTPVYLPSSLPVTRHSWDADLSADVKVTRKDGAAYVRFGRDGSVAVWSAPDARGTAVTTWSCRCNGRDASDALASGKAVTPDRASALIAAHLYYSHGHAV